MRRWGPIGLVLLVAALGAHPAAAAGPTAYAYDTTAVGIDRPFTIGIAGDGTVWVGGSGAYLHNFPSRILRFDPFTGNALSGWPKTTEATASVPGINDLLVDGNDVWVADQTKSTITRARVLQNDIAPGYPKATGGTAPQGLAIGPDGDLWVANLNSNNVSRFDHSSGAQIGGYPKPTGNPSTDQIVGANDVTIGDDGDAWVSIWDPGAGKGEVTRLDGVTGDVVTGYPETLNSTTKTVAIATGLDGDIWVASESSDLSRLDPETGAQRLGYPKYTEQMQTGDMAIGPDGDVWITDQALSKVIRVDGDTGATV
ncbi:MAG: large repetitive protein, partial [Thermoleophilaceae bacterium]|nr:large repetitive protein [Thermoleophilaceae bacterium]